MPLTPAPPAGKGRGAWTRYGGLLPDNGRGAYYRLNAGNERPVGSHWVTGEDRSDHARAVNRGVAAIQTLAGLTGADVDGWYGKDTDKAVRAAQSAAKVAADGIVGPTTMRAWLTPLLTQAAGGFGVPLRWLGGICALESNLDPGAVGYETPDDKGLVQIRLPAHPDVTYDQVFDPLYAIWWAAREMCDTYDWYPDAKADRWAVAALWHNSPRNAQVLARTGQYPTAQAADYVKKVSTAW